MLDFGRSGESRVGRRKQGECEMAENQAPKDAPKDWASDVKKYAPGADDTVIAGIVRHCGIALRTRDASLVSFTDTAETDRVRESFCKRKLGLTDPDEVLDAAIAKIGERMSDTNFRNRVTVYYLLAEHFDKLALFGGKPAAAAASPAAAPAPAPEPQPAPAVPLAAMSAAAPAAIPHGARPRPGGDNGDFFGLAALVFGAGATIMLVAAIAAMYISSRSGDAVAAGAEAAAAAAAAEAAAAEAAASQAAAAIPEGAGIISEMIEGKPKVSVFFAVGSAGIAPEFAEAVAPVKAWLEANPDDGVQLSGFTDPTGDAALNAELAKNRAEAVAAALVAEGVAAERIDLVKPADVSDADTALSEARRVEITVTGS